MLQDLEEQVREFVKTWEETRLEDEEMDVDSEDEEIVFVGRSGEMSDTPPSPSSRSRKETEDAAAAAAAAVVAREKLILESLAEDKGAKFGFVPLEVL